MSQTIGQLAVERIKDKWAVGHSVNFDEIAQIIDSLCGWIRTEKEVIQGDETPPTRELSTIVDRRRFICCLMDQAKPYLIELYGGSPMELEEKTCDQFMEYLGVITAFLVTQRDALTSSEATQPQVTRETKPSVPPVPEERKEGRE